MHYFKLTFFVDRTIIVAFLLVSPMQHLTRKETVSMSSGNRYCKAKLCNVSRYFSWNNIVLEHLIYWYEDNVYEGNNMTKTTTKPPHTIYMTLKN